MKKLNVLLAIYVNLEVLCEEKPLRCYYFRIEWKRRHRIVKLNKTNTKTSISFQTVFLQIEPPNRYQVWLCSLAQSNKSDPYNCQQRVQQRTFTARQNLMA